MAEECANPLLLGWIAEWLEEARQRNSKGITVYKKAYDSMKACPLLFDHPSEAQALHGLGPKLCDRLTEKLKTHCAQNGLPSPKRVRPSAKRRSDNITPTEENPDTDTPPPPKRTRKAKAYVPGLRSGAYGLILALSTLDEDAPQGLSKSATIELAQPHCDASFTAPSDPTKHFTAWNSIKTLLDKDLVHERGRPVRRYMLTEEGWEVARRIKSTENAWIRGLLAGAPTPSTAPSADLEVNLNHINCIDLAADSLADESDAAFEEDVQREGQAEQQPPDSLPSFEPIVLPPGSFTVHLIIDSREVRTVKDREYIAEELQKHGIAAITRGLPLGDALWVARPKQAFAHVLAEANIEDNEEGSNEIVLDYIVERKRLDDLIFSIKDGRFHEQKFRLRRSGIPYVTYIIENFSISVEKGEKYGEAVASAIASTQVVNGYFIKETEKLDDTIKYLVKMTNMLQELYETKALYVIPSKVLHPQTYLQLQTSLRAELPELDHYITFSAFASLCSKSDTMSLRDIFIRMLMCIRGVTGDKAMEIQKKWRTPIEFFEAIEKFEGKAKERVVADGLGTCVARKKVTAKLSARIVDSWS